MYRRSYLIWSPVIINSYTLRPVVGDMTLIMISSRIPDTSISNPSLKRHGPFCGYHDGPNGTNTLDISSGRSTSHNQGADTLRPPSPPHFHALPCRGAWTQTVCTSPFSHFVITNDSKPESIYLLVYVSLPYSTFCLLVEPQVLKSTRSHEASGRGECPHEPQQRPSSHHPQASRL